jgi:hypothetical protein
MLKCNTAMCKSFNGDCGEVNTMKRYLNSMQERGIMEYTNTQVKHSVLHCTFYPSFT